MSGELPYAPLLRACYRIVDAASYLDWGLTSDYDAGVTAQPHPQPHPDRNPDPAPAPTPHQVTQKELRAKGGGRREAARQAAAQSVMWHGARVTQTYYGAAGGAGAREKTGASSTADEPKFSRS